MYIIFLRLMFSIFLILVATLLVFVAMVEANPLHPDYWLNLPLTLVIKVVALVGAGMALVMMVSLWQRKVAQ